MNDNYTLAEAVRRLESVPEPAQRELRGIMLEILFRKQRAGCSVGHVEDYAALEGAGLIVLIDDPELAMQALGRNELVSRLVSSGVSGFKKNSKLTALVEWCMESDADIAPIVSDVGVAIISPALQRVQRKLYTYLVRKYDTESCYDPDKDAFVEVPSGAAFVATVGTGGSSLKMTFPEDEITALLDLYGCNRCGNK